MKNMGIVQGSAEQAQELIVGIDTVYVHTNIIPVTQDAEGNPIEGLFQFNEVQYDKDEYIKVMAEKNDSLDQQLTDTQLALCEVYEGMV